MSPTIQLDPGFVFTPVPPIDSPVASPFSTPSPLGPLEPLAGSWTGKGFNTIWRPHFPLTQHDRFLELNLTDESLDFTPIKGQIPNRGLLQADINMFGLTYMDQISDAAQGAGLHIEPGIWAVVPATTDPHEGPTVVRMATIPHGTAILAQGTATTHAGAPVIPNNNIIPFPGAPGTPPPPNLNFSQAEQVFTELNLALPSQFRSLDPGVTQAMVQNPNSVLQAANVGKNIVSTTTLQITTHGTPIPGGGTAITDFLQAGNAIANVVTATFWIETIAHQGKPDTLQLQYSQTVMLQFNTLQWPHVTVSTLTPTMPHVAVPAQIFEPAPLPPEAGNGQ